MKYKNVGTQKIVISNVGEFAPGDITPDLQTPIFNPDFQPFSGDGGSPDPGGNDGGSQKDN